jgi:hypothetical protein
LLEDFMGTSPAAAAGKELVRWEAGILGAEFMPWVGFNLAGCAAA